VTGSVSEAVRRKTSSTYVWLHTLFFAFPSGSPRRPCTRARLFPDLTLDEYEQCFRIAAKALGTQALQLTPHVLRHSGPSNDRYLNRLSQEAVVRRGAWLSISSVRRYEKHTKFLRTAHKLPASLQKSASGAGARLRILFGV